MHSARSLFNLAIFVEVARRASFSQAADRLGLSPATASRKIKVLEHECGAKLLHRSTRRVELTRAGAGLLAQCGPIVDAAARAHDSLRQEADVIAGPLKIGMSPELGVVTAGLLSRFAQLHPAVRFDLDLAPQSKDVMLGGLDIALRTGEVLDGALVCRQVGRLARSLVAAPSYLAWRGVPAEPAELAAHDVVLLNAQACKTPWNLTGASGDVTVAVEGRFMVNDHSVAQRLAENGMGITAIAGDIAAASLDAGALVRVLPGWSLPSEPVCAVTTSRMRGAAASAFIEFLAQHFGQGAATRLPAPVKTYGPRLLAHEPSLQD